MSSDDRKEPTQDRDRTQMRPTPGRRGIPAAGSTLSSPLPRPTSLKAPSAFAEPSDRNALLTSANRLLTLGVQLRSLQTPPDLDRLFEEIIQLIGEFELAATKRGAGRDLIMAGRYCLCTFLDEAISTTPWGGGGQWDGRRLLVKFHNEAFGGEKFFVLLGRAKDKPNETIELLELMHVILALGFLGRYANRPKAEVGDLREELFHSIQNARGKWSNDLSARWQPADDKRPAVVRWIPLWVVTVTCMAIVFGTYALFASLIGGKVNAATDTLNALNARESLPASSPATAPAPSVASILGLSAALRIDIENGLVEVDEKPGLSTATIPGDGLFDSGKSQVKPKYVDLLVRIAKAVNAVRGNVEISGHTDSEGDAASNHLLSKARADAVWKLMAPHMNDPSRLSAKGFGADRPRRPNDSPQNRAMNRRVEISLTAETPTQAAPR